jgi:uncharacterized surface protein with fasciclin (FAS1) repeats
MKLKLMLGASMLALCAMSVMAKSKPMVSSKDIVEFAADSSDFSTLVAAVKAASLVDTLKGAGPFTVFAPTNDAFAKLPAGIVETLLKPENKETLSKKGGMATVTKADVMVKNGVIHVIDAVVMPN